VAQAVDQLRPPQGERTGELRLEQDPSRYRHWRLGLDGDVATVTMHVDPHGGLRQDVELKLNSYDLAVDIELADLVQRLRFEHPEIRAVVLTGGLDKVFSAGANIQVLAAASHDHKVNFCKFTNETRLAIEDASRTSRQVWICAVNGTAAGGGYELALACDEIVMIDDRASSVSLPEVPLLGVLPGTGGLTRLIDKRHVRHDLADAFCTKAEGLRAPQALAWGLVDSTAPFREFEDHVRARAAARAAHSDRPGGLGVTLGPLSREATKARWRYRYVKVALRAEPGTAEITLLAPDGPEPSDPGGLLEAGDGSWLLATCRELDDAVVRLQFDEPEIGTWVFRTSGDHARVLEAERVLAEHPEHWLVREITAYWARTLRRIDVSSRTLVALVDSGSCFAGLLAELVLGTDRSFMLEGPSQDGEPPTIVLSPLNDGPFQMWNGLTRVGRRHCGRHEELKAVRAAIGEELGAERALALGLVTVTPDDLDWEDEVRLFLEERASYSPDALTGLEANLRAGGPETMETRIFGRLSAWQNWIFLRENASGREGALRRYGSGSRPVYDRRRV
jgi:benzoyl-CoA-dihydrodiol lyase